MPLDPSIAMGARLPQISVLPDSPVNAMARVEEVRGAQMANQLRAMQMQQAQREAQQNELANRLYAESIGEGGEIDYGKLMQGMAQGGLASRIPGVLEQRAATQSRAAERQLREEQLRNQQLDAAYKMLKAATPENYAQLRAMGISRAPALANVLPEQFDQRVIDALTGQMEQYFAVQPGGQVFSRRTGQAVGEQVPFKPEPPAAPPAPPRLLSPEEEQQKIRIALASRPPAQPRERQEPAPVAVLGPDGKPVLVPREQAIGRTPATAFEGLSPKEQQNREAKFPQATVAVKSFEASTDTLIADLQKLSKHPGLNSITGIVAGRVPGITSEGREAEALLNKILARGGFQELQNMRQASPTGGALGNVSNQEGTQLRQAFAALDRTQDAPSIRKAIADAIQQLTGAKERVREAYDMTYEYKQRGGEGVPTGRKAPASGLTAAEQAELEQLRKRFGK
jgi:hypothetical protein